MKDNLDEEEEEKCNVQEMKLSNFRLKSHSFGVSPKKKVFYLLEIMLSALPKASFHDRV